jgi:hypothetical protein
MAFAFLGSRWKLHLEGPPTKRAFPQTSDIARLLDLSKQRISQILRDALGNYPRLLIKQLVKCHG